MGRLKIALIVGSIALTMAACGQEGQQAKTTTTSKQATDPQEAMRAYTACMRERGVDLPDMPSVGSNSASPDVSYDSKTQNSPADKGNATNSADSPAFEAADKECSKLLQSSVGNSTNTPAQTKEQRDRMVKFAECMREHGIDMNDSPSGSSGGGEAGNANGQARQKAIAECSQEPTPSGSQK